MGNKCLWEIMKRKGVYGFKIKKEHHKQRFFLKCWYICISNLELNIGVWCVHIKFINWKLKKGQVFFPKGFNTTGNSLGQLLPTGSDSISYCKQVAQPPLCIYYFSIFSSSDDPWPSWIVKNNIWNNAWSLRYTGAHNIIRQLALELCGISLN